MVKVIATSEFANAVDTGNLYDWVNGQTVQHEELLAGFGDFISLGNLNPVSLSATKFVFDGTYSSFSTGIFSFKITVQGSGLSPVSSFADLQAAFEAGMANGDFSSITIRGSKAAQFPGDTVIPAANFLKIDLAGDGYTMTSGDQVIKIKGILPTGLDQFFELGQLNDKLSVFNTLTTAEKTAVINDLNDYGINELSFVSEGVEIFKFAITATSVSLTLMGYTFSVIGSFSDGIGDAVGILSELDAYFDIGKVLDFSDISGTSVTKLQVKNADGDVILQTRGPLDTTATTTLTSVVVDGVKVVNEIIGQNTSNDRSFYTPGDFLTGTNGKDHMFGLSGHDTLNGGKGHDFLYGGTGSDRLNGGDGNDYLNAGDNRSVDFVTGSKGNDKIAFSDNVGGYHVVSYADLNPTGGIDATVNAKANTGTILKGAAGTDTLIDVNKATGASIEFPATGGLGITGTANSDSFVMTNSKGGWLGVIGGDGVDSYDLTLTKGSISRIAFWDATNGAKMNIGKGTITDDGFGNAETITLTQNGGRLEIYGTSYDDRIIGSSGNDRFILAQGNDFANGGGGNDLIRYDRRGVDPVTVDLDNGTATGTWNGVSFTHTLKNFEDIRGSRDGNDILIGNGKGNKIEGRGGNDSLTGKGGRDALWGEDGDDALFGNKGRDKLVGGAGDDLLEGGGGKDVFIFDGTRNEGKDTVTDFQDGIDMIRIQGASFADLTIRKAGPGGVHTKVILDSGTEILLKDMDKSDVTAADFDFI